MIPWTQQPVRKGDSVPRPRTGETPIQHVRIAQDDWAAMKTVLGRRAPAVVRELIRWYLRRPGAKLPERPSREALTEASASTEDTS